MSMYMPAFLLSRDPAPVPARWSVGMLNSIKSIKCDSTAEWCKVVSQSAGSIAQQEVATAREESAARPATEWAKPQED